MSGTTHTTIITAGGNGYVATALGGEQTVERSFTSLDRLVGFCQMQSAPVVLQGFSGSRAESLAAQLRKARVVVLSRAEAERQAELDAHYLATLNVGDRVTFNVGGGAILHGEVKGKGDRFLEVLPDGWRGRPLFVAGRQVEG